MTANEEKKDTKLRFDALGHWITVEMAASMTVTPGGIYLPDEAKREAHVGTVLSKGEDVNLEMDQGDIVVLHPYGGHYLKDIKGCENLRIIKDTDCLAVVRKEDDL